ncbi:MAG: hypothetical protein HY537_01510 [Deltaproteobacteria bacterium]|nr:hypothetical protein [Deltaproteobacteria bacterium]
MCALPSKFLAFILLFACLLGGCLGLGTGEPIPGGKPAYNPPDPAVPVRVFFNFSPGYVCFKDSEQATIPSYRDSILMSAGRFYRLGDKCNPVKEELSAADVEFSADTKILGYRESIYIERPEWEILPYPEVWCRISTADTYRDLLITNLQGKRMAWLLPMTAFPEDVTVTGGVESREFSGASFQLIVSIDVVSTAGTYSAELRVSQQNVIPVWCRIVKDPLQ